LRTVASRRLRVVTLIDTISSAGGAERIAASVMMGLDPERFERTMCASRAAKSTASAVRAAGVKVVSLDRRSAGKVWEWRPLMSLLRRERIDILHSHLFGSNVWGSVLGRIAGVPVIVAHEHSWSFEGQPARRFIDREVIARFADVIVAVSREDRRRMIEIEGIDPSVVRFIPNGIAATPAIPSHDVRVEFGIPAEAPVVAAVTVLRREKALDVLIDAAGLLAPGFPGLRVLIAGRGKDREALERYARERGLDGTVAFIGLRRDVADLLASADVAVNSSDFEGSPLSVIEYLAAGKAVVATRVGGVPDIVEDGVHGLLVERRDPVALANALARLLRDPALRAEMGARGRARQQREFTLEAMIGRIEELYEELFHASARGRQERSRAER
jgi:glycosyltransferase involved in cell wall biosynthesis